MDDVAAGRTEEQCVNEAFQEGKVTGSELGPWHKGGGGHGRVLPGTWPGVARLPEAIPDCRLAPLPCGSCELFTAHFRELAAIF